MPDLELMVGLEYDVRWNCLTSFTRLPDSVAERWGYLMSVRSFLIENSVCYARAAKSGDLNRLWMPSM